MATLAHLSLLSKPSPPQQINNLFSTIPKTRFNPQFKPTRFKCLASQTGFFTKLGRLIKEKAKSDVEKIFSGFSKTRDNLAVIDELLLYWNLSDTDRVLDELEEALLVSDFGPRITIQIVERLRDDILAGNLKSGSEIKDALKKSVLDLLEKKGNKTELQLGFRKPAVVMIVGVNGGGKTTSLGFRTWSEIPNLGGSEKNREMAETSSSTTTTISEDLPSEYALEVKGFFERVGIHASLPQNSTSKDFYSDLFRDLFKADNVQRGHVSCIVPVLPVVGNAYNGLHGGAVGAIAERVSIACARTVVADDKELFLGELSITYLSAAKLKEVLVVEGSVLRSGRNLTVVASEFRIKKTKKLVFTSRATFYHMPAAKL